MGREWEVKVERMGSKGNGKRGNVLSQLLLRE